MLTEHYRAVGTLLRDWFTSEVRVTATKHGLDKRIQEQPEKVDPRIAWKYSAAWSIHRTDSQNYSGNVSEMRDVVTMVLHKLAPDDSVVNQPGFKFATDQNGKPLGQPTRKQRVTFIMRSKKAGKSPEIESELGLFDILLDHLQKSAEKAYADASAKTHTFATDEEAWRCLKQMDSILAQLM